MAGNQTSSNTHKEEYHWKDSWLFTLGADYTINDAVTVRSGVGYEISPVDDDKYRSATIPDTDRLCSVRLPLRLIKPEASEAI